MHTTVIRSTLTHGMAVVVLILCAVEPAYAYLDPGTGSILLQAVLATVAGALVSLKLYGQKIRVFFMRLFARSPQSARASESETLPRDEKTN